jgi:hypothetical protein
MAARRKEPSPIRTLVVAAFVIILLLAIWLVIAIPRRYCPRSRSTQLRPTPV